MIRTKRGRPSPVAAGAISGNDPLFSKLKAIAPGCGLFLLVFVVFLPSLHNGFSGYDDPAYVTANPIVQKGLTLEGLRWAFNSSVAGNWHPLTMLSHMLDCQWFGLNAWGHHLASLLFHAANAVLFFWFLNRVTRAPGRSFLVAALFGLHPLHVESVAWVAERKDVLSTFFWALTLCAYALYAEKKRDQNPRARTGYVLALLFFCLGLMSKPMLVTLPLLLLLLDYWPLQRWHPGAARRLCLEKIPFLAIAALASLATVTVQKEAGAFASLTRLPFPEKIANALNAYVAYIGKMLFPANLSAMYLHPDQPAPASALAAGALLLGLSLLVFAQRQKRPYLFVGWFWFAGTLIPVIGLVQVGVQAMADRYTYVPLVGLFLAGVWGLNELIARLPRPEIIAPLLTIAVITGCIIPTRRQISYWQDQETLFRHVIAATKDNWYGHRHLARALEEKGNLAEARFHYREALRLKPTYSGAHDDLGSLLFRQGSPSEAIYHFREAIRSQPDFVEPHGHLAEALLAQGRTNEALEELKKVIDLEPNDAAAHNNAGLILRSAGLLDEAIAHYQQALKLAPGSADTRNNLGAALLYQGRLEEAIPQFEESARLNPGDPRPHNNLGAAFYRTGRLDDAIGQFQQALRLQPDNPRTRANLNVLLQEKAKAAPAGPARP